MTRRRYRERLFPEWVEELLAVLGLVLIVGTFGVLAVIGYAYQQGLAP